MSSVTTADPQSPPFPAERALEVLVVGDDPIVADGIACMIGEFEPIVPRHLPSLDAASATIAQAPPDVLVWVPDHLDAERLSTVCSLGGGATLVLARSVELGALRSAYLGGVRGLAVILRRPPLDVGDVARAAMLVARGLVVTSPILIEQLLTDVQTSRYELARLTKQERTVLRLMAKGLRNSAIAQQLGRSDPAIEKHVSGIFRKLGLTKASALQFDRRVKACRIYLLGEEAAVACGEGVGVFDSE